jgi:hypothetical protein
MIHRSLTPAHHSWPRFYDLLTGPEGCNFRQDGNGKTTWTCYGGWDKRFAWTILTKYFPGLDPFMTMDSFERRGGHCDCEILFNVGA